MKTISLRCVSPGRGAGAVSARQRAAALAGSGDSAPVHLADRQRRGEMDSGVSSREMGSHQVNPSDVVAQPGVLLRFRRERERQLREGMDMVVTVAGVCLCALGTMILSHML